MPRVGQVFTDDGKNKRTIEVRDSTEVECLMDELIGLALGIPCEFAKQIESKMCDLPLDKTVDVESLIESVEEMIAVAGRLEIAVRLETVCRR